MSGSVEYLQSWPGAVIEPVILSPLQVILIYLAIAGIFIFWVHANRKGAYIILGTLLIFSIITGRYHVAKVKTSEIVVYQVPGHMAMDLVHNRQAFFICDSLLRNDSQKTEFLLKPNRINLGIKDIFFVPAEDPSSLSLAGQGIKYPFIFFEGKTIVIIDNQWKNRQPGKIISCDLAVFSGKKNINPEKLRSQIGFRQVIIDSSVPFYRAEQLMKIFRKEGVPCHSVRQEGAFVMKW